MKGFIKSLLFNLTVIGMSTVLYAVFVMCRGKADFGVILITAYGSALFNIIEELKEKK